MQGLFDEKGLEEKFSEELVRQPVESGRIVDCRAMYFVFVWCICSICCMCLLYLLYLSVVFVVFIVFVCCQPEESGRLEREVLSQGFKPEVKERRLGRKTFKTGDKQAQASCIFEIYFGRIFDFVGRKLIIVVTQRRVFQTGC